MLAGEANGYNSFGNGHILASLRDAGDPIQIRDLLIHSGVDDRGIEAAIVLVPADRYEIHQYKHSGLTVLVCAQLHTVFGHPYRMPTSRLTCHGGAGKRAPPAPAEQASAYPWFLPSKPPVPPLDTENRWTNRWRTRSVVTHVRCVAPPKERPTHEQHGDSHGATS